MKTVKILSISLAALFLSILFYACSKDGMAGSSTVPTDKQNVSLYLTDAPAAFDKVLIDIQSVQALVDTCSKSNNNQGNGWFGNDYLNCSVWDTLNISPGVYNLLNLQNGTDTLLTSSNLPTGNISFIKIQLGPIDSLVKDSVSYPLHLRDSSIILIDVRKCRWDEFKPRSYRLWLDFDVEHSVVMLHDNQFYLDPVIRVFTLSSTGSVSGDVNPGGALPAIISVYNGSDTAYAISGRNGQFEVRGLNPGTYSVFVNPSNGYADTTISGVTVSMGGNMALGNINLHK
jgi:hypothetical protein